MTGLEPACLATLEPKSNVSANSTTSATDFVIISFAITNVNTFYDFYFKLRRFFSSIDCAANITPIFPDG